MTFLEFAVLALFTWRISSLLVEEDGPFDIFMHIRHFVGVKYGIHSEQYGENIIAQLFACMWCMSIWIGTLIVLLYIVNKDVAFYISVPFALSAVAIIAKEIIDALGNRTG